MDDDKVLVCFYYSIKMGDEPKQVVQFSTSRFAEWMKLLHYCKQNSIEFWVRDDDEKISPEAIKALECGSYIDDIFVSFGTDECIQSIHVYLK